MRRRRGVKRVKHGRRILAQKCCRGSNTPRKDEEKRKEEGEKRMRRGNRELEKESRKGTMVAYFNFKLK